MEGQGCHDYIKRDIRKGQFVYATFHVLNPQALLLGFLPAIRNWSFDISIPQTRLQVLRFFEQSSPACRFHSRNHARIPPLKVGFGNDLSVEVFSEAKEIVEAVIKSG